jgi:hypothetical protein
LPDLIRLALAGDILEVQQFVHARVLKDVMTSADAGETKSEALDEVAKISKGDVLKMTIEKAA